MILKSNKKLSSTAVDGECYNSYSHTYDVKSYTDRAGLKGQSWPKNTNCKIGWLVDKMDVHGIPCHPNLKKFLED